MKHTRLPFIIGLIAVVVIGIAVYTRMQDDETTVTSKTVTTSSSTTESTNQASITLAEVEKNNGKNGTKCWVIVDTTVYEISGFAQWVDGVHTSSGGRARCGKDQTDVIGDSPHGRSVLRLLTVVGSYQQ